MLKLKRPRSRMSHNLAVAAILETFCATYPTALSFFVAQFNMASLNVPVSPVSPAESDPFVRVDDGDDDDDGESTFSVSTVPALSEAAPMEQAPDRMVSLDHRLRLLTIEFMSNCLGRTFPYSARYRRA
jgi:hypothetical protein